MTKDGFKKLKGRQLLVCSVAFFVAIFFLRSFITFSIEGIARLTGKMETVVLSVEDFENVSLVGGENGKVLSTDADPQLILTRDMKVARISFKMETTIHPGEVIMYYATKEGQGFSPLKRNWFFLSTSGEDKYETSFRLKNIKALRIDPTTVAGNEMKISEIIFNEPKSVFQYFKVEFIDVFKLIVYSCILASVMMLVQEIVVKNSKK